jgi:hypothetical protein
LRLIEKLPPGGADAPPGGLFASRLWRKLRRGVAEGIGELRIGGHARVGESLEEGDEVGLLGGGEVQRRGGGGGEPGGACRRSWGERFGWLTTPEL